MENEKRMAGDYVVLNAIRAGYIEVVLGENQDSKDERYMCAVCTQNDIFIRYDDVMVSDNYTEILKLFGERIAQNAQIIIKENEDKNFPLDLLTKEQCFKCDSSQSIVGKIVAMRGEELHPQCQTVDKQLFLVTGGSGANGGSRGSAVYCTNIYTGKKSRWERNEVLGEVKPEQLPQWAKDKVKNIKNNKERSANEFLYTKYFAGRI